MSRSARSVIAALALLATVTVFSGPAAADQPGSVTVSGTIDGHDVAAANTGQPLRLDPDKTVDASVDVTNHGQNPVEITEVQLVGRVLGLTFFNYATSVNLTVAPGTSGSARYRLDFSDLKHQATGLLGGELIVRDRDRNTVAAVPTVTDVRGSLLSVYGVFGLALLVLTVLALADALIALARHKGSPNRFRRGLRMLTPGIGIGLVLAFSASVARLWVPRTPLWLSIAGITAVVFFALGYFSPTPEGAEADETEDEEADERDAAVDDDAIRTLATDSAAADTEHLNAHGELKTVPHEESGR